MDEKYFYTEYFPPMYVYRQGDRPPYGCGLWAKDEDDARRLIVLRNLPEEKLCDSTPSENHKQKFAHNFIEEYFANTKSRKAYNNALHALMFLCYQAQCCNIIDHHSTIGDGGLVHEFLHLSAFKAAQMPWFLERLCLGSLKIEYKIPGRLNKEQKEYAVRHSNLLLQRTQGEDRMFGWDLLRDI